MRYTADEAARYLGVTINDLRTARKRHEIAFLRLSPQKIVYLRPDLDAWRESWQRTEAVKPNAV